MEHSITQLLKVSLESIKEIVDVDTIVGDAIVRSNFTIIPVSKVKMGILSGGTDMKKESNSGTYPFGGGTGGTVTITPIAFLVCSETEVKLLHVEKETHLIENLIERVPEAIQKLQAMMKKEDTNDFRR